MRISRTFCAVFLMGWSVFFYDNLAEAKKFDTLAVRKRGGTCRFGDGSWNAVLNGARAAMKKVLLKNNYGAQAAEHLDRVTIDEFDKPCNSPSTPICAHGGPIRVKKGIATGNYGTYSMTIIHELCHTAGDAIGENKGSTIQTYYAGNLSGSCPRISGYAAGGGIEEFAEACTAYLLAPGDFKSGCGSNYQKVKNYFENNLFETPIENCGGGDSADSGSGGSSSGDGSNGSIPPVSPPGKEEEEKKEKVSCTEQNFKAGKIPKEKMDECASLLGYDQAAAEIEAPNTRLANSSAPTHASTINGRTRPAATATDILKSGKQNNAAEEPHKTALFQTEDHILGTNKAAKKVPDKKTAFWNSFFEEADQQEEDHFVAEANQQGNQETIDVPNAEQAAYSGDNPMKASRFVAGNSDSSKTKKMHAGMTLHAVDGITGPFWHSVWRKIEVRYDQVEELWKIEGDL